MNRFTRRHDSLRRPAIDEECCCRHRHSKHPHNAILPDTDRPRPSERTKHEAARYLQISVRTLQRHHTAGLITGRYLQTGMCQVVFEQAELDRYNKEADSASPPQRAKQKIAASPMAASSPITSPIKPAALPPPTAAVSETSALTAEVARLCALLETLLIVIADQSATGARATTTAASQASVTGSTTSAHRLTPRSPSLEHDRLCR